LAAFKPHQVVEKGIVQVPEGRRVFGRLTVTENLEMGAFTRNDKKGISQSMERVYALFPRLRERRSQVAGTLSGGEQQMLAMARGLMGSPKILLLDEPSMGLAPVLVDSIFETIQGLHQAGTTILLVEQNARMALQVADRGYVMQTGEIVLSGSAEDLRQNSMVQQAYLGM
jgi:branched-chain amino acid transport system ATP-binding protein